MRKYQLLLLLSGAITLQAQAQTDQDPFSVTRFAKAVITHVHAETSGGNITVNGSSETPSVEMFVRLSDGRAGRMPKEELQRRLQEFFDVRITCENGTVSAIAVPRSGKRDWRNGVSVSFRITVPVKVTTELQTSGGNIDLSNLEGKLRFATSGGNLTINNTRGQLYGQTSGGNIRVKRAREVVRLTTSGGNIEASDCAGSIELTTSGGNIRMQQLKGEITAHTSVGSVRGEEIDGLLSATTSGGNISLEEISGGITASTSGGNIDLEISSINKPVKVSNFGGSITLRLPKTQGMDLSVQGSRVSADIPGSFKGSRSKDSIEGTVNGGGQPVRIRAGSGSVRITMD